MRSLSSLKSVLQGGAQALVTMCEIASNLPQGDIELSRYLFAGPIVSQPQHQHGSHQRRCLGENLVEAFLRQARVELELRRIRVDQHCLVEIDGVTAQTLILAPFQCDMAGHSQQISVRICGPH